MLNLWDVQTAAGAVFEANRSTPISFGNDAAAIEAARQGVAIADCSHWGRIEVSDSDRLSFLHNQSTNDFKSLQSGQGCDTVFVTSTARTLDLATAYVLDESILLLVSPNRREKLMTWLDRYIFFGDKVKLTDVTEQTVTFSLLGPDSRALMQRLGVQLADGPDFSHQLVNLAGQEVRVALGSSLGIEGLTLIADIASAAALWSAIVEAGAVPLGDRAWENLRIEQGRPMPDHELTEDYNPLEAGLWKTISFSKGCYIGQETIARLDTYKGVKQQLWGIHLNKTADPGTPITLNDEKIGTLTSATKTEQGCVGLAYIRTKAGGEGLTVQAGTSKGKLVGVPFLMHDRPQTSGDRA